MISQGLRRRCAACSGYRPIHLAAICGHVQCLKRLLELGVDRDPRDKEGMTPLHMAAQAGHAECVKALLDAEANVRAKTGVVRARSLFVHRDLEQHFAVSLYRPPVSSTLPPRLLMRPFCSC